MYFHLEPNNSIINDINTKLMDFYRGVRDDYVLIREELDGLETLYVNNRSAFDALKKLHPDARVEDANEALYYELRDMYNGIITPHYHQATLYYFINKTAYSGMIRFNARGEYNVPYGRYKNFNTKLITEEHQHLLSNTDIHNEDYRVIFEMTNSDDFDVTVEVSLSSGALQFKMEGEPVPRHIGIHKEKTKKPTYCFFIAPTINPATIAYFFSLYLSNIDLYGGKCCIIPLRLDTFRKMLKDAVESDTKPTPEKIKKLFDNSIKYARQCFIDEEKESVWFSKITEDAKNWLSIS